MSADGTSAIPYYSFMVASPRSHPGLAPGSSLFIDNAPMHTYEFLVDKLLEKTGFRVKETVRKHIMNGMLSPIGTTF